MWLRSGAPGSWHPTTGDPRADVGGSAIDSRWDLETKFAALVSYGLTVELLKEVLPISQDLSTTTIRERVRQTAQRLEDGLGEEQDIFIGGCQRDWDQLPDPAAPLIVGIDGGYVHAKDHRCEAQE